MMKRIPFTIIECDSRSDAEARIQKLRHVNIVPTIAGEESRYWGILQFQYRGDGHALIVGRTWDGSQLELIEWLDRVVVGTDELITTYDKSLTNMVFQRAADQVFRTFVRATDEFLIWCDEMGFFAIDPTGKVVWSNRLGDVITRWAITDAGDIAGSTLDGKSFLITPSMQ